MNNESEAPDAGRRRLLAGAAVGGAAVIGGVAGAASAAGIGTGGGGWLRETVDYDVACLGWSWREGQTTNLSGPDDFRLPFFVEGHIYGQGTVGDGFVPDDSMAIGRWFCQGWLLVHAERGEPHVSSRQVYVLGAITEDRLFPEDTMASVGLEGTGSDQVTTRIVNGGTGRFFGAAGSVSQQLAGFNTTVMDDGTGDPAPNFTMRFDLLLPDI